MNNWTFPEIEYQRPDLDALIGTLHSLTEQVKNAVNAQTVIDAVLEKDRVMAPVMDMITTVMIRNTLNTTDPFYEAEQAWVDETMPTFRPHTIAFDDAVSACPYRKELEERFGKNFFLRSEVEKKAFCEENIPLMQREAVLCTEYQKIMATAKIEFEGETLNLFGVQKHFEDADRAKRAAAWKAYSGFYEANETRLEEIWDELIRIRNQMGKNLGYENFIPVGYLQQGRTDYGMEEVAAFRRQVKEEIVPLCEKLYAAQARRLGIDAVYAFDEKRVYPDGNAVPAGDDDFMVAEARKMYHDRSAETGEFIDFMIDHQLMDLLNKPGKAATGYCATLPARKAPFVFSCFNQTIADMEVLSHELGHAFAAYRSIRKQPLSDMSEITTDIAEIHSMGMEQFAQPYAEQFFGKDAEKFRFAHLQQAITFVPFAVCVDEFQHICYAHPELTPKERTYEWHKLEETYMPWRKYGDDPFMARGGWWYHKIHIFLYPFYYINYALTTIGAMEFRKKMREDRTAAWRDYLELCDLGTRYPYLETLRHANVNVPFAEGAVANAMEPVKADFAAYGIR